LLPPLRERRRDITADRSRDAAFSASSLVALCQSGGPLIRLKRKAQKVVPDQAACAAMRRSFASAAPFMV